MVDIAFPGIVMVLKILTKLFVGRSATLIDFIRAMVALPVDVTFLALSFGAAILYATPSEKIQTSSLKLMFVFAFCAVAATIITTAFCHKSDKALDESKTYWAVGHSVITYGVAIASLIIALNIKVMI